MGLTSVTQICYSEKKMLVKTLSEYRYPREHRTAVLKALDGIVRNSRNIGQVKSGLIMYLQTRYTKKSEVVGNCVYILHTYKVWKWLIATNNQYVGFGIAELEKYDQTTGLIGRFNGVDCLVSPRKLI